MSDAVQPVLRRAFAVAAGLLVAAAAIVVITLLRRVPSSESGLGESFRYDLSALRKVDPALIIADERTGFPVDVPGASVLALGPSNVLYIGGADEVARLDLKGKRLDSFKVSSAVTAIGIDPSDGRILVGLRDRIEIHRMDGEAAGGWPGLNSNAVITAIVPVEDGVFVADAGNRLLLKYGADGNVVLRFGEKASEYSEGFVIPSAYFPLVAAPDDTLWIVDPGRHRFVNLSRNGRFLSSWEKAAMTIEGFCGCCNPTHFAIREDRSFVTAEKGLPRVKVHRPDGTLAGVVAAPDQFAADTRGLALVVDESGRVLVLDPERGMVRVFEIRNGDR